MEFVVTEQDRQISETVEREKSRLRNFIRTRVVDREEAEDILQDVFSELVEGYRLMKPVEQVGAWLFRVARNRITDLFRKKKPELFSEQEPGYEDFLPSGAAGPEEAYAQNVLFDAIGEALNELPEEQRFVFIAHEVEGVSFKQLAAETGLSVNTLLSRKRYAVARLREKLGAIYEEFMRG
ncbi:MAG: sigma-70 family RNA polymerase sigma factor [Bryobacteraceae bacterium]|nr:sigma-70 family RNA polymerase sigma factor [Bryobacteraceae bacterium]